MSWSATPPTAAGIAKSDVASIVVSPQTSPEGCVTPFEEQRDAAFEAVAILAKVVGQDDDLIYVTMSGHANPDHAPAHGWADECITISVSRRAPIAEEATPPQQ